MIENITSTKFYHTGYPATWVARRNHLYALFSQQDDCFIYVNSDLDLVRRVQCVLFSKIPVWIFDLQLPQDQAVTRSITNQNAEEWTLDPNIEQPRSGSFVNLHDTVYPIDCNEVNILGEITGIVVKQSCQPNQWVIDIRNYAMFCAWLISHLKIIESPHEEIMCRIAMANALHTKTTIVDNDLFIFYSKIYQALWLSSNLDEAKTAIAPVLEELKNSVRIGKKQHLLDRIVNLELL